MTKSRRWAWVVPGVLGLVFGACVGGLDPVDGSDPPVDGADPPVDSALGDVCTPPAGAECPAAHNCVTFQSIGDPARGYCSPACATPDDCLVGYDGPRTGQFNCIDQGNGPECVISCASGADCPGTLTCQAPPGAPMQFCATPVP